MSLLVSRNVLCSVVPSLSSLHAQVYAFAKGISDHLLPSTTAYHEIWLDKKLVAGEALKDFEPLYGQSYLPRKVCLYYFFSVIKSCLACSLVQSCHGRATN